MYTSLGRLHGLEDVVLMITLIDVRSDSAAQQHEKKMMTNTYMLWRISYSESFGNPTENDFSHHLIENEFQNLNPMLLICAQNHL